jgi:hypothetical protein
MTKQMNSPAITSIGPPPDLHAERITDEMVVWMRGEYDRLHERTRGVFSPKTMGTIEGQWRAVQQYRQAAGDLAIDVHLEAAKRGRFKLNVMEWTVLPNGWLGFKISHFTAVNHLPRTKTATPVAVSRHAIIRLAQRGGVRTVADLIAALNELWSVLRGLMNCVGEDWLTPPDCGWHLPIQGADGKTFAVAVLERDNGGARRLVLKTVLEPDMNDHGMAVTYAVIKAKGYEKASPQK